MGRTRVIREQRPLEDVNQAISDVLHSATSARIVFDMHASPARVGAPALAGATA